jgi:hypothetical protein
LFRIVIIHSRLVELQVLSFDYLVFSFYRSNEYYLVLIGVIITGTKITGTLGAGAGTMIGAGTGVTIGFGTTIGAGIGEGLTIGFGTTIGAGVTVIVAGAAEAVVIKARIANAEVAVLIITCSPVCVKL